MDRIGANRHNNNNNELYNNAVNCALEIENNIQNFLPQHCTLILNENINQDETCVLITFTNPHSNHTGRVLIGEAAYMARNEGVPDNGYVHMLCSIDAFNGYFLQITVDNFLEMIDVIAFCQNLLEYQPENEQRIDYIRVPLHLLNHRYIQPNLRQLNMNANLEQNVGE